MRSFMIKVRGVSFRYRAEEKPAARKNIGT
jgi:hypothetical protein